MQTINSWHKNGHRNFPVPQEHRILSYDRLHLETRVCLNTDFNWLHISAEHANQVKYLKTKLWWYCLVVKCVPILCEWCTTKRPNSSKMKETHTLNKLNFIALSGEKSAENREKDLYATSTSEVHVNDGKKLKSTKTKSQTNFSNREREMKR